MVLDCKTFIEVLMKSLFALFLVSLSLTAFGRSCEEHALEEYSRITNQNEYHYLTGTRLKADKNAQSIEYFGTQIRLGFDKQVEIIIAASEYMGGLGYDALVVDPSDCRILQITNVYTE